MFGKTFALATIGWFIFMIGNTIGKDVGVSPDASTGNGKIAATINGEIIPQSEFESRFRAWAERNRIDLAHLQEAESARLSRVFLQELIDNRLIEQAAAKEPLKEEAVDEAIEEAIRQYGSRANFEADLRRNGRSEADFRRATASRLRRAQWLAKQLPATSEPSQDELKAFWQKHPGWFGKPAEYRTTHILWVLPENADNARTEATRKQAAEAAAQARSTGDLESLRKSLTGPRIAGGDRGFLPLSEMQPEYAHAVQSLNPGEISDPVRTAFGWHVIQLTETKGVARKPFQEVESRVKAAYLQQIRQQQQADLILSLRQNAIIEVP